MSVFVHSSGRATVPDRYAFGRNWLAFREGLGDAQITAAQASLRDWFGPFEGLRFLDIGCGSGLFSLAAHRLGADVTSMDIDPDCVACTRSLEGTWPVEEIDVLDDTAMSRLGHFDIVYAWGSLHHTGAMWDAIDAAAARVAPGGRLLIALYHDQGRASRRWWRIKRRYNRLPPVVRAVYGFAILSPLMARYAFFQATGHTIGRLRGRPPRRKERGMSRWHDWWDWVGGFPFEVAAPAVVEAHLVQRGFTLDRAHIVGGRGCNEFLFRHKKT